MLSADKGAVVAGPGDGGGAGGVRPGIRSNGSGEFGLSEGSSKYAFFRHKDANSKFATGTAYESPSVLKIIITVSSCLFIQNNESTCISCRETSLLLVLPSVYLCRRLFL